MKAKKFKQYCPDLNMINEFDHQQEYILINERYISVDKELKDIILALNIANLPTFASCIGKRKFGGIYFI